MIKRTIEISREPAHLSTRLEQLVVQPIDQTKREARSIPCEDIGIVLVDQPQTTYTHGALTALLKSGAAVVICGRDHLPAGILLPMSSNSEVVWRMNDQIAASITCKKQLWRQIVVAKIKAQAQILGEDIVAVRKLNAMTQTVKSGDTTNIEAQAAKVYWQSWRNQHKAFSQFQRAPKSIDLANGLFNYGYAVLRAAVARTLVSTGLVPALGIHHRNRANTFCLADDLMEPLRPMVDRRVRRLVNEGVSKIDQAAKAALLEVLTETVRLDDTTGPLMVALHRVTASLARCLSGDGKTLLLPVAIDEATC